MSIRFLPMILSVLTFLACKTTETKPIPVPKGFDWQGHRGSRGLMPENSLEAFQHALTYGDVTTLELDLAVSKDNQLIVSHEPWFNPAICLLPNGDTIDPRSEEKLLIYERTAQEIRGYDCGSKGNKRFPDQKKTKTYKPTLKEVVEMVRTVKGKAAENIRWNIEIKSQLEWDGIRHPAVDEFVRLVIEAVKELKISQNCTVQSFDIRALQSLHRQAPELQLAFLVENTLGLDRNLARLGFTPQIYSPYYLLLSKKVIRACHQKNMKVIPWTVNDVKSMRRLIRIGVDGIITDYPNRIEQVYK